MGLLGIAAFFLWAFGLIYFIFSVAHLIFPEVLDIELTQYIESKKSKALSSLKSGLFIIFAISTFVFTIWFYYHSVNKYEYNQLVHFGVEKRVEVKNVFYGKHKSVDFEFEINDIIYKENLPLKKDHLPGDTIEIIVSKNNPTVVWYVDKFKKIKNSN